MKSELIDLLKFLAGTIIVVVGWIVGYRVTIKRDRMAKRRDISMEYLINAYRILAHDVSHRQATEERNTKLELIIADIQLFGSVQQIELANQLAIEIGSGKDFDLDPLLNNLRNSLRKEIGLSKIDSNVRWVRLVPKYFYKAKK